MSSIWQYCIEIVALLGAAYLFKDSTFSIIPLLGIAGLILLHPLYKKIQSLTSIQAKFGPEEGIAISAESTPVTFMRRIGNNTLYYSGPMGSEVPKALPAVFAGENPTQLTLGLTGVDEATAGDEGEEAGTATTDSPAGCPP